MIPFRVRLCRGSSWTYVPIGGVMAMSRGTLVTICGWRTCRAGLYASYPMVCGVAWTGTFADLLRS